MDISIQNEGERYTDVSLDAVFCMLYDVYRFVAPLCKDRHVVELGSGTGYGAFYLAGHARSVDGFERDQAAVGYACQRYRQDNLRFHQGDILQRLPLAEPADIVVSSNVFEHVEAPGRAIAHAADYLGRDGLFILAVPAIADHGRMEWENNNPFHLSNWFYGAWARALHAEFEQVEGHIQQICYEGAAWNAMPEGERADRLDGYSDFRPLDILPFGNTSQTSDCYANVVFICRRPRKSRTFDLASDPVSASRRLVVDELTVDGWTEILRGGDRIEWRIDAQGWIGGLNLVLGNAGLRSRGHIVLGLRSPEGVAKRHVVRGDHLLEGRPTEIAWSFYREPIRAAGELILSVESGDLTAEEGFNIALSGSRPAMRLWETIDPVPARP